MKGAFSHAWLHFEISSFGKWAVLKFWKWKVIFSARSNSAALRPRAPSGPSPAARPRPRSLRLFRHAHTNIRNIPKYFSFFSSFLFPLFFLSFLVWNFRNNFPKSQILTFSFPFWDEKSWPTFHFAIFKNLISPETDFGKWTHIFVSGMSWTIPKWELGGGYPQKNEKHHFWRFYESRFFWNREVGKYLQIRYVPDISGNGGVPPPWK